ncbi:uncharacterized protein LOC106157556 isoform X2 [Lingula anatina]|uniref:Uncharacterized protein LOC106157556 isoform X2 n=1 Tax=Lingula anatina TaxID=7574 RepID=A0A1S3HRM8_LINAN|nr:uncharacterized protein LOC106157556 isoform X2 [Lingula anatina]|eukprot:XP_013388690.1 uncharacterized protein LOC106157556 isoform X2 [Lingula anatina]
MERGHQGSFGIACNAVIVAGLNKHVKNITSGSEENKMYQSKNNTPNTVTSSSSKEGEKENFDSKNNRQDTKIRHLKGVKKLMFDSKNSLPSTEVVSGAKLTSEGRINQQTTAITSCSKVKETETYDNKNNQPGSCINTEKPEQRSEQQTGGSDKHKHSVHSHKFIPHSTQTYQGIDIHKQGTGLLSKDPEMDRVFAVPTGIVLQRMKQLQEGHVGSNRIGSRAEKIETEPVLLSPGGGLSKQRSSSGSKKGLSHKYQLQEKAVHFDGDNSASFGDWKYHRNTRDVKKDEIPQKDVSGNLKSRVGDITRKNTFDDPIYTSRDTPLTPFKIKVDSGEICAKKDLSLLPQKSSVSEDEDPSTGQEPCRENTSVQYFSETQKSLHSPPACSVIIRGDAVDKDTNRKKHQTQGKSDERLVTALSNITVCSTKAPEQNHRHGSGDEKEKYAQNDDGFIISQTKGTSKWGGKTEKYLAREVGKFSAKIEDSESAKKLNINGTKTKETQEDNKTANTGPDVKSASDSKTKQAYGNSVKAKASLFEQASKTDVTDSVVSQLKKKLAKKTHWSPNHSSPSSSPQNKGDFSFKKQPEKLKLHSPVSVVNYIVTAPPPPPPPPVTESVPHNSIPQASINTDQSEQSDSGSSTATGDTVMGNTVSSDDSSISNGKQHHQHHPGDPGASARRDNFAAISNSWSSGSRSHRNFEGYYNCRQAQDKWRQHSDGFQGPGYSNCLSKNWRLHSPPLHDRYDHYWGNETKHLAWQDHPYQKFKHSSDYQGKEQAIWKDVEMARAKNIPPVDSEDTWRYKHDGKLTQYPSPPAHVRYSDSKQRADDFPYSDVPYNHHEGYDAQVGSSQEIRSPCQKWDRYPEYFECDYPLREDSFWSQRENRDSVVRDQRVVYPGDQGLNYTGHKGVRYQDDYRYDHLEEKYLFPGSVSAEFNPPRMSDGHIDFRSELNLTSAYPETRVIWGDDDTDQRHGSCGAVYSMQDADLHSPARFPGTNDGNYASIDAYSREEESSYTRVEDGLYEDKRAHSVDDWGSENRYAQRDEGAAAIYATVNKWKKQDREIIHDEKGDQIGTQDLPYLEAQSQEGEEVEDGTNSPRRLSYHSDLHLSLSISDNQPTLTGQTDHQSKKGRLFLLTLSNPTSPTSDIEKTAGRPGDTNTGLTVEAVGSEKREMETGARGESLDRELKSAVKAQCDNRRSGMYVKDTSLILVSGNNPESLSVSNDTRQRQNAYNYQLSKETGYPPKGTVVNVTTGDTYSSDGKPHDDLNSLDERAQDNRNCLGEETGGDPYSSSHDSYAPPIYHTEMNMQTGAATECFNGDYYDKYQPISGGSNDKEENINFKPTSPSLAVMMEKSTKTQAVAPHYVPNSHEYKDGFHNKLTSPSYGNEDAVISVTRVVGVTDGKPNQKTLPCSASTSGVISPNKVLDVGGCSGLEVNGKTSETLEPCEDNKGKGITAKEKEVGQSDSVEEDNTVEIYINFPPAVRNTARKDPNEKKNSSKFESLPASKIKDSYKTKTALNAQFPLDVSSMSRWNATSGESGEKLGRTVISIEGDSDKIMEYGDPTRDDGCEVKDANVDCRYVSYCMVRTEMEGDEADEHSPQMGIDSPQSEDKQEDGQCETTVLQKDDEDIEENQIISGWSETKSKETEVCSEHRYHKREESVFSPPPKPPRSKPPDNVSKDTESELAHYNGSNLSDTLLLEHKEFVEVLSGCSSPRFKNKKQKLRQDPGGESETYLSYLSPIIDWKKLLRVRLEDEFGHGDVRSLASSGRSTPCDYADSDVEWQSEEKQDKHFELKSQHTSTSRMGSSSKQGAGRSSSPVESKTTSRMISTGSSYSGSRRGSDDSTESTSREDRRDLKNTLAELEEKYKKAMMTTAQLDNEKQALVYEVDLLKDKVEELEETMSEAQRECKDRTRELDMQKRDFKEVQREFAVLKVQLEQRDKLIEEHGLVLVAPEAGEPELSAADLDSKKGFSALLVSPATAQILEKLGEGSIDDKIRRLASEKEELLDQVKRLRQELEEERDRNSLSAKYSPNKAQMNGPSDEHLEQYQREASKQVQEHKAKLQKAEADITALEGNVIRLESQVKRYKAAADNAEKAEEELKTEKRKLQRELRDAQSNMEHLQKHNQSLQRRLDKMREARFV